MFVGREAELGFFEDKYMEKKGQLIVLYGRRRVGKTETLREFCKDKPHVFFSCTQATDRMQLSKFSNGCCRRISRPDVTFRNLQTGKRPSARLLTCLTAIEKNWSL